ncbi:MAG: hypothetical protein V1866_06890 [archaeon]
MCFKRVKLIEPDVFFGGFERRCHPHKQDDDVFDEEANEEE